MPINLSEMLTSVANITGVDIGDAPNVNVINLLNRSWWEIMDKFKFREKDTAIDFALVIGSERYDVPDQFEALRSIAVYDTSGKSHYLDRVTSKWYEENYSTDPNTRGFPTHYFREGNTITVYPTPDAAYAAVLRYTTTLLDLTTLHGPEIPQSWHELIMYGGAWRVCLELGDFQKANSLKQHQVGLMTSSIPVESKEASDSRHANLEVIRNDSYV